MKYFMNATLVIVLLVGLISACGQLEEPLELPQSSDPTIKPLTGASPPIGATETVDLIAAQTEDIGSVTCWINGDFLFIQYMTEGGWSLAETHCAVVESLEDIPATPSENPKVGHFPLKKEHDPFTTEHTDSLDLEAWGFGEAEELIIAAHADVEVLSGEGAVLREEGAWGMGESFSETVPEDPHQIERPDDPSKDAFTKITDHPGQGRGNWAMYFTVNVKKLKGLILWNKLGSEHEVTHSRVGPDGVIVGDIEYLPCQHGNGFKPLERTGDRNIPDNFIDFYGLNLGQQGCIEFWYHPDWIDSHVGCVVGLFYYGLPSYWPEYLQVLMTGYNDWQDLANFNAYQGLQDSSNQAWLTYRPSATPGWTTAEPFHMAFMWDGIAPDQQDRVKMFINGNPIGSYHISGDPTFSNWPADAILRLGSRLSGGDWNRHHWEGSEGIIDNIKIWNYPKTDFSDRFKE
ncbi:MAG: hypothetical protein JSV33_06075 [bacterium]|nr:MAG: hypothetical protein JSV33_06075 [bacterium]